jgi:hypothetical protein
MRERRERGEREERERDYLGDQVFLESQFKSPVCLLIT